MRIGVIVVSMLVLTTASEASKLLHGPRTERVSIWFGSHLLHGKDHAGRDTGTATWSDPHSSAKRSSRYSSAYSSQKIHSPVG